MQNINLERMIRLAEEFFETRSDPEQITVTEETMTRLATIHPATLSEERDENGPIAWVLLIPTTADVMNEFLAGRINERQLLDSTHPGIVYDAVYLCSALVLPEQRCKGLAKRLALQAIKSMQRQHQIRGLFYWAFSAGGKRLADSISKELGLPLYVRQRPG